MRALALSLLAPGCGLMITEEEYLARIQPVMSGELRVPEGVWLPGDAATLGLVEARPGEAELYPADPAVLVSGEVRGLAPGAAVAWSMNLPPSLDGEELPELDPGEPGMTGRAWGLAAWADGDGVEGFGPEDHYLGATVTRLLAWIDAPQGSYEELGAISGYNLLTYDVDRQRVLSVQPVDTTRLSWNLNAGLALRRRDGLDLIVSIGGLPRFAPRVDLYRAEDLGLTEGSTVPDPVLASLALESRSGTELATLDLAFESPRADHLNEDVPGLDLSARDLAVAWYVGIGYDDTDGDGAWGGTDAGELPFGASISQLNGDSSFLVVCFRPMGFNAALAEDLDVVMGWQLVEVQSGAFEPMDWSDGLIID